MDNISAAVPHSLSMQDIAPTSVTEIVGAIVSSWRPGFLARTLLWQGQPHAAKYNPCVAAVASLKAQFMNYESTIEALHVTIDDLEYDNKILTLENKAYEHDVSELRADISNAVCDKILLERAAQEDKDTIGFLKLQAKQDQAKIEVLTTDLDNARKFISYMVDIDLHTINPLRNAANMTIDEHMDAEDSLLESITEASKRRGSVWSRIVPAIQGPRAPENYVSAINMTLQTRKDLRRRERASHYWKEKAKLDPAHVNLVTPSSSDLDDLLGPAIRQKIAVGDETVLDDLMDMVKPADSPFPPDFRMAPELQRVVDADAKLFPRKAAQPVANRILDTPTIIEPSSSSITDMLDSVAQDQDDVFQEIASLYPADEMRTPINPPSSPSASSVYSSSSTGSFTPRALVVDQFYQPEVTVPAKLAAENARPSSLAPLSKPSKPFNNATRPHSVKETNTSHRTALRAIDTNRARSNTYSASSSTNSHGARDAKKENVGRSRALTKTSSGLLEVPGSPSASSKSFDSHSGGAGHRASAKLLGKRNGVILAEKQDVLTMTPPSTPIDATQSTNRSTPTQPTTPRISTTNIQNEPQQESSSELPYKKRLDSVTALEAVLQDEEITRNTGICVEALESLESILSSMSSDDLGSLEPSEVADDEEEGEVQYRDEDLKEENRTDENETREELTRAEASSGEQEGHLIEEPRKKGPFEEEDPEDFADVSDIKERFEAGFRRSQDTIDKLEEIRKILDIEFPLPQATEGEGDRHAVSPVEVSEQSLPVVSPSESVSPPASRASVFEAAPANPLVSSSAWADAETSSEDLSSSLSLGLSETSDLSHASSQEQSGEAIASEIEPATTSIDDISQTQTTPVQTPSKTPRTRLPMVSGIARRIGRAVMSPEKETAKKSAPTKSSISYPRPAVTSPRTPATSKTNFNRSVPQQQARKETLSSGTTNRLRSATIAPPIQQKSSTESTSSPAMTVSAQTDLTPTNRGRGDLSPALTRQQPKVSAGRNFLRRLSNMPGSTPTKSKSTPSANSANNIQPSQGSQPSSRQLVTSTKPRSHTIGSPLPHTLSTTNPQVLSDPSGRALIASRLDNTNGVASTKPRSNTITIISPTAKSPLAQSIVTVSSSGSDLESNNKTQRRSGASHLPVLKRVAKATTASNTTSPRASLASPTTTKLHITGRTTKPSGKPASTPARRLSAASIASNNAATPLSPPSVTPLKTTQPASPFSSRANKRMTNSIKPLIPTWSGTEMPSPAQCRNVFRNSLSMVVR